VTERLPADPTGQYGLGDHSAPDNDDAYRIEFETASHAIAAGATPAFGRADAVDQTAAIEAVRRAAATGARVVLPHRPRRPHRLLTCPRPLPPARRHDAYAGIVGLRALDVPVRHRGLLGLASTGA